MRPHAPPPPTDPFDRLLRRVADEARRAWVDPALSRRVETAIRRPEAERRRLPARLLARVAAVAAVVLAAAGVGPSAPGTRTAGLAGAAAPAVARPAEPPEASRPPDEPAAPPAVVPDDEDRPP